MKILRSIRSISVVLALVVSAATTSAQEAAPDDVRPVAAPQAVTYDASTPLFANPRPGVFVPVTLPVVMSAAPPVQAGMPRYAFVVELRVGGGGIVSGTGTTGVLSPSLFLGARLFGRLHLGLGFGLTRVSLGIDNALNGNDETTTSTVFDVEPTASIDLVQAHDRRVALYLKVGIPLGASFQTDVARQMVVGYDLALGVRYLPHPMFGIGFEGGVTGLYVHPTHDDGSSVTIIYGAIVGSFFAGKQHAAR